MSTCLFQYVNLDLIMVNDGGGVGLLSDMLLHECSLWSPATVSDEVNCQCEVNCICSHNGARFAVRLCNMTDH